MYSQGGTTMEFDFSALTLLRENTKALLYISNEDIKLQTL